MTVGSCLGGSALLVSKVVACSTLSFITTCFFNSIEKSIRGVAGVSLMLFLPSLVFVSIATQNNVGRISMFSWSALLACVPKMLALLFATLLRCLYPTRWHGLVMLSCVLQNGFTSGLGILLLLKGFSWYTAEVADEALGYFLCYSTINFLCSWLIAELVVKPYAEHQGAATNFGCNAMPADCEKEMSNWGGEGGVETSKEVCNTPNQDNAQKNGTGQQALSRGGSRERAVLRNVSEPINHHAPFGDTVAANEVDAGASSPLCSANTAKLILGVVRKPLIIVTITAIFMSMTPVHKMLHVPILGTTLVGGMKLVAFGTLPLHFLLFGYEFAATWKASAFTLTGATSAGRGNSTDNSNGVRQEEMAATEQHVEDTRVRNLLLALPLSCNIHVIVPLLSFFLVFLLKSYKLIPVSESFLFAVLVGACPPTAVDPLLFSSNHPLLSVAFSKIMHVMIISGIVTTFAWLTVYLRVLDLETNGGA